jgi:hypothetical protein
MLRTLSLNPEELEKLSIAYEDALGALQLSNQTGPLICGTKCLLTEFADSSPLVAPPTDIGLRQMGKSGIPKTTLITFAKLGHLNDASGENFAGSLCVPIRMKSGAGGLQRMPSLFEGVAEDANGRRIKRRCIGRNWKRQNRHCGPQDGLLDAGKRRIITRQPGT